MIRSNRTICQLFIDPLPLQFRLYLLDYFDNLALFFENASKQLLWWKMIQEVSVYWVFLVQIARDQGALVVVLQNVIHADLPCLVILSPLTDRMKPFDAF
jgi:hypothetical protein